MDVQSGESEEEQVNRKQKNWYQNEVDEEKKGADSRDKVKHNRRSDQLLLERMMKVAEEELLRMKSEYCEDVEWR